MKVILLQDVRGIGRKNDVKNVSDGYARNLLFPKNLARPADAAALKEISDLKARRAEEDAAELAALRALAAGMAGRVIDFEVKADAKGSVFGSVTKDMIAKALRQHFAAPERIEVKLNAPLKALGEHSVGVDLGKGVSATLTVRVLPQR